MQHIFLFRLCTLDQQSQINKAAADHLTSDLQHLTWSRALLLSLCRSQFGDLTETTYIHCILYTHYHMHIIGVQSEQWDLHCLYHSVCNIQYHSNTCSAIWVFACKLLINNGVFENQYSIRKHNITILKSIHLFSQP